MILEGILGILYQYNMLLKIYIELHAPTNSTQKLKLMGRGGQFTYIPTVMFLNPRMKISVQGSLVNVHVAYLFLHYVLFTFLFLFARF